MPATGGLVDPPAPHGRFYLGLPDAKQPELSPPLPATDLEQESAAADPDCWVEVTHPFHPWRGRMLRRQYCLTTGKVALVRCIVDEYTLRCLPRAWTHLREVDDFERVSAGRAYFRTDDLVALRALVDTLLDDQQ